jgi:hypothetical protein
LLRYGVWKEQFMHDQYGRREEHLKAQMRSREARKRQQSGAEQELQNKERSDMIVK